MYACHKIYLGNIECLYEARYIQERNYNDYS